MGHYPTLGYCMGYEHTWLSLTPALITHSTKLSPHTWFHTPTTCEAPTKALRALNNAAATAAGNEVDKPDAGDAGALAEALRCDALALAAAVAVAAAAAASVAAADPCCPPPSPLPCDPCKAALPAAPSLLSAAKL